MEATQHYQWPWSLATIPFAITGQKLPDKVIQLQSNICTYVPIVAGPRRQLVQFIEITTQQQLPRLQLSLTYPYISRKSLNKRLYTSFRTKFYP